MIPETKGEVVYARFGRRVRKLKTKSAPRVLLLQGPVGPFFNQLQYQLDDAGYDAWRICFTPGDRIYASRKKRITYSAGLDDWPGWLDQFLADSAVDCIVLFGCERPVHARAIKIAKRRGIPVVSLEEGYIRPGFITVENGGNNRRSPLAASIPPENFVPTNTVKSHKLSKSSFSRMCWLGFSYYLANFLSSPRERRTFHKNRALLSEAFCWTRNLVRKIAHQGRNFATIERLLEHHDKKYFVVPLQVSDDSQLRAAARGWTTEKLIIAAISSFANHAGSDTHLVFKIHPLERGHTSDHVLIKSIAQLHNVRDRVDIIDTGSVGLLVRHAAGMITINSTSGLSAVAHGIPLLVTGEAIYSNTPFSHTASTAKDFDTFWTQSSGPDRVKSQQYLSWLRERCLIPGDLYAHEGVGVAIPAVIGKVALALRDNKADIRLRENGEFDLLKRA